MVAIRGADVAEAMGDPDTDPGADLQARVVDLLSSPREVTARDVDILRTRLELLHDMADGDREERERHRLAVHAEIAEMEQRLRDIRRDHRGIRQTLGDLAAMVNRHTADGSAARSALDELRSAVLEVRNDTRDAVQHLQRETRRSIEQLEAHIRADRDWIGATQAHVERLARAGGDLVQQRDAELERTALLEEQLADAMTAIEQLRAESKRQAALITRLRADLKKAPSAPTPAKATPKRAAAKTPAKRTSRAKPGSTA